MERAPKSGEAFAMMRYVVTNRITGVTERLYETLGEAIAAAIKLIDEGADANVINIQASGAIEVGRFKLRDAEGYLHRSLGSETFEHPLAIREILDAARRRHKRDRRVYHWDTSS